MTGYLFWAYSFFISDSKLEEFMKEEPASKTITATVPKITVNSNILRKLDCLWKVKMKNRDSCNYNGLYKKIL